MISVKRKNAPNGPVELWHYRLVLSNISVIKEIFAAERYGMSARDHGMCQASSTCVETKSTKAACIESLLRWQKGITVHTDVYGTMQHSAYSGYRYVLVMVAAP